MSKFAVALGMFDSVHIGHRAVIESVLGQYDGAMVMTFDALPNKKGGLVLSETEKQEKLMALGIDTACVLEFERIKDLSPKEFLDYLTDRISVGKIACGFNFRFGKGAVGDTELIKKYCDDKGIEYYIAPEVKHRGETVSTTRIKELLLRGDIKTANELLGEAYSITARVVEGDKRGRRLGFPTINQKYPSQKAAMRFGVYETEVNIDGKRYRGVTNLGLRPTFKTDEVFAETYIVDFSGDCYKKDIKLSFLEFLRDEKSFESIEALRDAISNDVLYVKNK